MDLRWPFSDIDPSLMGDMPSLSPKQAVLGMKICKKYKGQLPSELYSKIYKSEDIEREQW